MKTEYYGNGWVVVTTGPCDRTLLIEYMNMFAWDYKKKERPYIKVSCSSDPHTGYAKMTLGLLKAMRGTLFLHSFHTVTGRQRRSFIECYKALPEECRPLVVFHMCVADRDDGKLTREEHADLRCDPDCREVYALNDFGGATHMHDIPARLYKLLTDEQREKILDGTYYDQWGAYREWR